MFFVIGLFVYFGFLGLLGLGKVELGKILLEVIGKMYLLVGYLFR